MALNNIDSQALFGKESDEIVLTIAIPSYNRNAFLLKTLEQLAPQLNNKCELLIVDNSSTTPVYESLKQKNYFDNINHVYVYRNFENIGGSANFLRCVEYSRGKWIWLLGDDDNVKPDAISTIFESIEEHGNAINISFDYNCLERSESKVARGFQEYLDKMDMFGKSLYISMNIFRRDAIRKYISHGYNYAYTKAPHLALLYVALLNQDEPIVVVSDKQIAQWEETSIEEKWNYGYVGSHMISLMEIDSLSVAQRKKLARFIDKDYALNYRRWLPGMLAYAKDKTERGKTLFYCHRLLFYNSKYRFSILRKLFHYLVYISLYFAKIPCFFLNMYLRTYDSKIKLEKEYFPPFQNRL